MMRRTGLVGFVLAAMVSLSPSVWAGPAIINGTDSNDHGSASGSTNLDGWLYIQKALENLAGTVTGSATKVLVNLGADSSTQAGNAIASAFGKSTLPGLGWVQTNVNGDVAIGAWLDAIATSNTGILYIPTAGLTLGDLTAAELAAINTRAAAINSFVSGAGDPTLGGALFSEGEITLGASSGYGWLSTLIPGIVITQHGAGGVGSALSLTGDGTAAFPGLTNADLSTGPWHTDFSGSLGGLKILATAPDASGATRNVILGGGAGTVIGCGGENQRPCPPSTVPEPASMLLFGLGGLGATIARRRRIV